MLDTFYIIEKENMGKPWYMLLVKKTHFCLSSGSDLDAVLNTLRTCVKKHKTQQRLFDALDQLSYGSHVSESTFKIRERDYFDYAEDYEDLVESTVRGALREVQAEERKRNPLVKMKSRMMKARKLMTCKAEEAPPEPPVREVKSTPEISRRKPVILKRRK